ncbi:MAG: hypothetical protein ACKVHQ_12110 [Gammaproteobacteria bacterium]
MRTSYAKARLPYWRSVLNAYRITSRTSSLRGARLSTSTIVETSYPKSMSSTTTATISISGSCQSKKIHVAILTWSGVSAVVKNAPPPLQTTPPNPYDYCITLMEKSYNFGSE